MTTNNLMVRLPAEWECHSAVLLSWPHSDTDWNYMLEAVEACYISVARAIAPHARLLIVTPEPSMVANRLKGFVDESRITYHRCQTNDTWARDFGMICTTSGSGWTANDFKFNGWGLKFAADRDNLINRSLLNGGPITKNVKYANRLNFVLEGGSIDVDEDGTLLTTTNCLLSPNRNGEFTKDAIEQYLKEYLGCSRMLWVEHGELEGDDTDSHIDTLARFVPGGIIAYSSCDREEDSHYEELKLMENELTALRRPDGTPYRLIALPIPDAIYDQEGNRLPATYANFLIINKKIFLPIYDDVKYDRIAIECLKNALPDYEMIPVNCLALIQQHGSLHCITMQIPDEILAH